MRAVEVKDLTFAYKGGKTVLADISFSVLKGEILVIAGLSGSGKTTLCHLLCGIIPHAAKGSISGSISLMGTDPASVSLARASLLAGLVFQDADSQIICTTIEDELAFVLENLCWPPPKIAKRVGELLEDFGFKDKAGLDPNLLSGGQKKLLTIAAVLAPAPPVLILDEPFSGLDAQGRDIVRGAIEEQRRQHRAVIIVEHDLDLVMFADKWLLLDKGAVAAWDTPQRITEQKNLLKELLLAP
ncbi:MAG: energy-coupling factor ABC transporter ATP-binding protein [Clostridiales bacterium]|nr:energy-coupling factor ABC transporter ATP-binding protein [Clostridiales bacterium]